MDAGALERQRAVEAGLTHAIRVTGRSPVTMALRDRMEHYRCPGVSIAVVRDGAIDWANGFGEADAERHVLTTAETRFQCASISKPVTAMTALRLVEEGRLDLDEDVNEKLTSWRVPDNAYTEREKVTLRRILTHTAGLTVHGFPGYTPGAPIPTTPQILDGEAPANTDAVRVDAEPGSRWGYSGGGYTVLQLLIEDITGEPFSQVTRDLVLSPVGMAHSAFAQPLPVELRAVAASAHVADGSVIDGKYNTYPELAAAGMWTTPSDLARLVIEVSESHAGRSNRVLSQAMTQEMLTPESGSNGLGFAVYGGSFGHGGGNEGFLSDLFMYVDGSGGAAIMTNGYGGEDLIPEVRRAIATVYDWPDRQPEEREVAAVDPAFYAQCVGTYRPEDGATREMRVFRQADALYVETTNLGTFELHPAELHPASEPGTETAFFVAEYGSRFVFHRREGEVAHELERSGWPFANERWPRVG